MAAYIHYIFPRPNLHNFGNNANYAIFSSRRRRAPCGAARPSAPHAVQDQCMLQRLRGSYCGIGSAAARKPSATVLAPFEAILVLCLFSPFPSLLWLRLQLDAAPLPPSAGRILSLLALCRPALPPAPLLRCCRSTASDQSGLVSPHVSPLASFEHAGSHTHTQTHTQVYSQRHTNTPTHTHTHTHTHIHTHTLRYAEPWRFHC